MDIVFQRLVLKEAKRLYPDCQTGRPRVLTDETSLDLIFRVLRTGMQWRELKCEVSHTTVLRRMHTWRKCGVFETAYHKLLKTYKKLYPTQYYCLDSAYIKNMFSQKCVGRNHTDRGRKAVKVSVVVDQTGAPHGVCCHPGNRPDVVLLDDSLNASNDDAKHSLQNKSKKSEMEKHKGSIRIC